MPRPVTVPYLKPSDDLVVASPWETWQDNSWDPLGDRVPEWDYRTTLMLRRTVSIDTTEVERQCHLPLSAPLALTVAWHATQTNQRGSLGTVPFDNDCATFLAELPGTSLGGQLALTTHLVLASNVDPEDEFAPRRAGTILWKDRVATHLEGTAAMFPMEAADFAAIGYPGKAAWYLEMDDSDLERATLGCLRLFVNSSHEDLRRALENGPSDSVTSQLLSTLHWDVMRQMLDRALDNPEFDPALDYPAGSLGASLSNLVKQVFGTSSVTVVRNTKASDRPEFETRIQAISGFLR